MSSYKRTLSGADVDALFAGRYEQVVVAKCDNCRGDIQSDDAFEFGIDVTFQMPVHVGGELERELTILRARHGRDLITLCYACTDALQEPICGQRPLPRPFNLRQPTPAIELVPRLFAVE
jgi:hypothetical protein